MSHAATNWAVKQRGLKPAAKVVLWHLADRHHPDYGCFPSLDTLAEDCEMSRRSVQNQLEILQAMGLIRREKMPSSGGRFQRNRYVLSFENNRGQNLPRAKFTKGKNEQEPLAKNDDYRGQNLPTNPVREPLKEPVRDFSFSEFWDVWPHKKAKDRAQKNWKRLSPQGRADAVRHARHFFEQWRKENPQANGIHPGTYLSEKRWQDLLEAEKPSQAMTPEQLKSMLASPVPAVRDAARKMKEAAE